MSVDLAQSAAAPAPLHPHLRPRGVGVQETTKLELFFDLVYVLAVTQLSHLVLTHVSLTSRSIWPATATRTSTCRSWPGSS